MPTAYYIQTLDGKVKGIELTEEEWFKVFLSGQYQGQRIVYLQQMDHPSKCVFFAENQNGS